MFNKLIGNLPFNPSLLGQVSFYSKRLRQEESVRRLGMLFVGLALFIQVFAVLVPPQESLAASDSNIMLGGGAATKAGILQKYDADPWVQFVYSEHFHISRDDINKMQVVHIHLNGTESYTTTSTNDQQVLAENNYIVTAGRRPNGSAGEQQFDAAGAPIYRHTLKSSFSRSPITALWCGKAECGRYKAIALDCGNPIMDKSESTPVPATPVLPPPPPPPTVPAHSPSPPTTVMAECGTLIIQTKKVQVKTPVKVLMSAAASGGAAVRSYSINYGDGTVTSYPARYDSNIGYLLQTSHTYQKAGTFTVTGMLKTSLGDRYSSRCAGTIEVTPEPVRCPYDSQYLASDSRCKPCPEDQTIPESDAKCAVIIVKAKKVANTTQKLTDANGTTAKSKDELVYTLTTTNMSKVLTAKKYAVIESIADILDYAEVVDLNGGTLGNDNVVRWPVEDIAGGGKLVKTMKFKVKDPIPATNVATSDTGTFDLKMVNVYGDTVVVNVSPPPLKVVESTGKSLPNTGPGTSLLIGFVATTVFAYFFARSRLLAHEMELVRAEYTTGGGF